MMEVINAAEHEVHIQAAGHLASSIVEAGKRSGHCVIGIAGGRSMPAVLDKLLPYAKQFTKPIEIFWLDERISPDKNFAHVLPCLEQLHRAGVEIRWHPLQSVHEQPMEVEMHQAFDALAALRETPHFDLVIVSSGEDDHVASLFPHHHGLKMTHMGYIIEDHSPKPPEKRVTVTPTLLCSTREAFLFFVGKKRHAYELFMDPKTQLEDCPAKLLLRVPQLTVFTSFR